MRPTCRDEMQALADDPPRGAIVVHRSALGGGGFAGAAIAVGAFDDEDERGAFAAAARAAGVPVNVIDKPAFCDFSFGAIVNRSPLVIGISTDGAAPVFAQAIRAKLEAMLPKGFADWATAAARWRAALKASGLSFAGAPQVLAALHRSRGCQSRPRAGASRFRRLPRRSEGPGRSGRERLGHVGRRRARRSRIADVARGARAAIRRRDPVRRSRVARGARFRAPRGEEDAGRQDRLRPVLQAGRHQRADGEPRQTGQARGAPQGRRSADLRPRRRGDRACRAANIAVEVVPGITAAQGAAARLGLSLTDRKQARRLQYITGHAKDGGLPDDLDWKSSRRSGDHDRGLHAGADACRAGRKARSPKVSIRRRRRWRLRARPGPIRPSSPLHRRTSRAACAGRIARSGACNDWKHCLFGERRGIKAFDGDGIAPGKTLG